MLNRNFAGAVRTGVHFTRLRHGQEKTEPKSSVFFACGGAEGSCLTARAHVKQGNLHKFCLRERAACRGRSPHRAAFSLVPPRARKNRTKKFGFLCLWWSMRNVNWTLELQTIFMDTINSTLFSFYVASFIYDWQYGFLCRFTILSHIFMDTY